ncbi:MAG TPA: hypothetical protein VJI66_02630 [Candidatus Paceibacterota bacterium]
MKNLIRSIFVIAIFVLLPQVTFAVWWNPLSWHIFNKKDNTEIRQEPIIEKDSQISELQRLKKEVEDLKKNQVQQVTDSQPIPILNQNNRIPPKASNNIDTKPQLAPITPSIYITPWTTLEANGFDEAKQKGWTSLITTNQLGEKRYFRLEDELWVRKNTEAEANEAYQKPLVPATQKQITDATRLCTGTGLCTPTFWKGYNTNGEFRRMIDDMVQLVLQRDIQNQQAIIERSKCLTDPLPPDMIGVSPSGQDYYRQVKCGTATPLDKTNYELGRLNERLFELQLQLK